MDRTYCQLYEEGVTEPWRIQRDTHTNRVWGVGEWGARVGMGAYFDWVMANALLPDSINAFTNNPLAVIDRTSVPELSQIVLAANDVQQMVDMADRGMNPLGLGEGAVPFDISPAEIDQGKTHFEQAYEKALAALIVSFNFHTPYPGVEDLSLSLEERAGVIDRILNLKRNGLPVLNTVGGLKAMKANRWSRPVPIIQLVEKDRIFECCFGREHPGVCQKCGYGVIVELSQILSWNIPTMLQSLSLFS